MTHTESGEWVRVLDVTFGRHYKAGTPPCLCVEYSTESGMFKDYVPIEHNTQHAAAISAKVWCQLDGDQPVPATVDEALSRSGELTVKEIEVCKTGRFWTVTARRCYRLLGPPVTYWAHGPPRPMW